MQVRITFLQLLWSDDGQDIVEYALLVAFVGIACLAAFQAFENAIQAGYVWFDAEEQNLGACTPDPWETEC
jgi:Flp pilus assembly pilin Flp